MQRKQTPLDCAQKKYISVKYVKLCICIRLCLSNSVITKWGRTKEKFVIQMNYGNSEIVLY
jgi:hypothetical protein